MAGSAIALDAGMVPAYSNLQHKNLGPLSFRLEPARPGGNLRLEVVDPTGKTTTKQGDTTLSIDVTDDALGRWHFRATAESVPYPYFPAIVVVGGG